MTYGLMVMKRGSRASTTWQVYEMNNPLREPGTMISTTGRLVRSVASWEGLKILAIERGVRSTQIAGEGLAEMEEELGPIPEW
jgi:hypothetical protein